MNARKKIILDTDIGGDCDDMGALAMLQNAHRCGKAQLLAVTISTANPYSAGCADAVNVYYGNRVPVGQTDRVPPGEDISFYPQSYGKHIAENFPNAFASGETKPFGAVKLLRKILAENKNGRITIVVIGSCINIAGLLESGADEYSELDGKALVAKQVQELVIMGGYFPQAGEQKPYFGDYLPDAECNIKTDVASARKVFSECPVPIAVSHYSVGWQLYTGGILIEKDRANPVAEAYFVHSHGNRDSWDPVAAYYAVCGADEFLFLSERGAVSVDEKGVTTFVKNKTGKHRLIECTRRQETAQRIDAMITGELFA